VSAFPRAGGRFAPPGGSTVSTVPPAARTASAAAADTAWTRTVSGFVISPRFDQPIAAFNMVVVSADGLLRYLP